MSAVTTTEQQDLAKLHNARPSFLGMLQGEAFKITRSWITWIMLVLYVAVITLPYLVSFARPHLLDALHIRPLGFYYQMMDIGLSVVRIFSGFFLLIITARIIGLEYQLGTIRILLSRGAGRLQLLTAKLLTAVGVALVLFVVGVLVNLLMLYILVYSVAGNLDSFNSLTPAFWADARLYILSVFTSMGVTILLAAAASVLGRSFTFGLSAALIFFPADNIGTVILALVYRLTNNDFWTNVSAYLLGPNINVQPAILIATNIRSIGATPLVTVDATHTWWVIGVYAAIFAVVAFVLTWRRDVKE